MLLLDENISYRNVKQLNVAFPGIKHVTDFLPTGTSDTLIWQVAKENNLSIEIFDEDYSDMLNLYGFPPKTIWLRFGNSSNKVICDTLLFHKNTIISFINNSNFGILEINEAIV
jgi:predicted nuclease of predicted toxin-antitoxin system